jgi:hypothetical protein
MDQNKVWLGNLKTKYSLVNRVQKKFITNVPSSSPTVAIKLGISNNPKTVLPIKNTSFLNDFTLGNMRGLLIGCHFKGIPMQPSKKE